MANMLKIILNHLDNTRIWSLVKIILASRFISEQGKILSKRINRLTLKQQRLISIAIKQAHIVRLKSLMCDVTSYKTKHESLTNGENKNQNIAPTMKELSCFRSFNLSFSLYMVYQTKIERCKLKDQIRVLYIGILSSRMYLIVIITN